jgi:hypothetical protein
MFEMTSWLTPICFLIIQHLPNVNYLANQNQAGYIFKLKIPMWVNFGGACNGRCWYIFWTIYIWPFGVFYGNLVYFVVIWYIFLRFGVLYREKSGNPETKRGNARPFKSTCLKIFIGFLYVVRIGQRSISKLTLLAKFDG